MIPDYDIWYCCLPDPERFMFATMAQSWPAWLIGYPVAIFNAAWDLFGAPSSDARRTAFLNTFGLVEEEIDIGGGELLAVYVTNEVVFWTGAGLWWYTGTHFCSDGCELKTWP